MGRAHMNDFPFLRDQVEEKRTIKINRRLTTNSSLAPVEKTLGAFIEMIEPQVRDAVLELNRKGYSTDTSGFMDSADSQTIEGDFIPEESLVAKLLGEGVSVETNNSGYTRIWFFPSRADIKSIRIKWMKIVSLFPDKGRQSDPSMTLKARDFRKKYEM